MKVRTLTFSMAIAILALPAFAANISMKPGKWKSTVSMVMSGEASSEPRTEVECVTSEEIDNLHLMVEEIFEDDDCKMTEKYKVKGNTITWASKCSDDISSRWKLVVHAETYKGDGEVKTGETVITVKMSGKYLGPCDEK